jgi:hypothetical protein
MALTPRLALDEKFISGMKCAICESPELKIVHVDKYPDFISCAQCGSAFVVESEGSWVMYGKIPQEYPETSQFALKQWTWLDAVAQRAEDERREKSAPPTPVDPASVVVDNLPEPVVSSPPVYQEIPPEPATDLPPTVIDPPIETTGSPQPFIEETPSPPMDELYPEEPFPVVEDIDDGLPQMPPFPKEVIILGDESSDFSSLEDATPSFMEPGPEEVIVPTPFDPIEVPEVIETEASQSMPEEKVQDDDHELFEDFSEPIVEEISDVYDAQKVESRDAPVAIDTPETELPTPAQVVPDSTPEATPRDEQEPVSSPVEQDDKTLTRAR